MADPTASGTSGRSTRCRRLNRRPTLSPYHAAGVLLIPVLTVAALALVRPADTPVDPPHPPTEVDLDRATAVCRPRLPGADDVVLGNTALVSGDVAVRVDGEDTTEALHRRVWALDERGEVVVNALRTTSRPASSSPGGGSGSATVCTEPAPEQWFTGVGAAAEHASTLTLINPDRGPGGRRRDCLRRQRVSSTSPALRGLRVPGGRSATFVLADVVPSRDALALRVSVSRGRLGASVVDVIDPVGRPRPVRQLAPGAGRAQASRRTSSGLGPHRRAPLPAASSPWRTRVTARCASTSGWPAWTASSRRPVSRS